MAGQTEKNLYMMTLGCPKNRVDSEVMLGTLTHRGYKLVQEPSDAQVIVVNTCAFIGPAKQESVDSVLEMAEHKKTGACKTLVVTGCLSQRYGPELAKDLPEVDHFLGTSAYVQIADLLAAAFLGVGFFAAAFFAVVALVFFAAAGFAFGLAALRFFFSTIPIPLAPAGSRTNMSALSC